MPDPCTNKGRAARRTIPALHAGGRAASGPRERQHDGAQGFPLLATLVLFAAAFVALAWPWLSGAVTIPWDAKAQFHPQLQFLAAALAHGESPFWTPHVFAGWPQIADPQSLIFSPPHLLLALLGPDPSFRAADGVTFALLFAGGCGVIAFFRDRRWHPAGALVAALVFAFGGSAASRLQHTGQIMSLAYLPIALWLIARALDRSSARAGAAAGVAAALMAIGRDQVALLGLYLLAGYVIAHWLGRGRAAVRFSASLAPLAACAAAFALVAAVPVVLTALLAADSNRPVIDYVSAGHGSLHPAHLLMLAFADLYGAADPTVDFWGPPSYPWMDAFWRTGLFHAQNIGQIYAGALPLITIVGIGLIGGAMWSREIRFFSIALAAALLYALGWYTPAFHAMYELMPGVALFRRPADATFVFGFLLAIGSGYLIHRFVTGARKPMKPWQRVLQIACALCVLGTALGVAVKVGKLDVSVRPILTGTVLALGAIGALVLARRLAARSAIAAALLLGGFTAADLAWNNGADESNALPPSTYEALRPDTTEETVSLLKRRLAETAAPDRRDRVEMIGIGYHWPNLSLAHRFDHLFGHNPLRLHDFARATGVGDTVASHDQRGFTPLFPSYRSTFADLFGLRVIASSVPAEELDTSLRPGDLKLLAHTQDAYVYENPRALPRVMLVPGWRLADFDELIRTGWPDVDPHRTVLLTRAPTTPPVEGAATRDSARIAHYGTGDVTVEVDAPGGGFLLLNDVWHPWWRAEVDGVAAEILRANVLFRAVQVPAGSHRVRFAFHPFAGALAELRAKFACALEPEWTRSTEPGGNRERACPGR
jgi:hypothetical protein